MESSTRPEHINKKSSMIFALRPSVIILIKETTGSFSLKTDRSDIHLVIMH